MKAADDSVRKGDRAQPSPRSRSRGDPTDSIPATNATSRLSLIVRKWREISFALFVQRLLYYGCFYVASIFLQLTSRQRYTVRCRPRLDLHYELWQCIMLTGARLRDRPTGEVSIGAAHFDATNVDGNELMRFEQTLEPGTFIVNGEFRSNSKDVVEKKFAEIFGYDLAIDPLRYTGRALSKSKKNAARDGRLVECPMSVADVKSDRVYQLLVDNEWDEATVLDYRVSVVGDEIPFVRLLWRSRERRFRIHSGVRKQVSETEEVLSNDECDRILALCRAMGLDFGALDVARSRSSGRIYVLDVNHTPAVVTSSQNWQGLRLRRRQARSFERQFLKGRYSRISGR